MEYNQFLSYIQSAIQDFMGSDATVSLHKVVKNNNLCLDGLTILPSGKNISPTIYLNSYYQDFLDGIPLCDIVRTILRLYENFPPIRDICPEQLQNFQAVRSRIAYRLSHFHSNRPLLKQIPHIPWLDLAIVFFVLIDSSPDEELTVTITREHLKLWHISEQQLFETAAHNTPLLYPSRCMALEQMIGELCCFDPDDSTCPESSPSLPMYILTNEKRVNGAACILYDHILQEFAVQTGGDFFVLPSSIHETILIPRHEHLKIEDLNAMVREINDTEVAPWDKLSDHVYCYHAGEQRLTIC